MSHSVNVEFPKKLQCLFKPEKARYRILYGGRGGAKSWGVARALLMIGASKPIRVLCAREFQNSISDSVHKLLSDQVSDLGLSGFYEIQQATIKGRNGTEFVFSGLRNNASKLKSYEGVNYVWCEEAALISKNSWEILIPTIRAKDSEIWLTFNPVLETDETYQRFVLNPPPDSIVEKINYTDNPWFPEVLEQERLTLKERDPDAYLNVWEGHPRLTLDGAIYANELRIATEENRITSVPYDAGKPVSTFWDLGRSDKTVIIMAQVVGLEFRLIDYYENRHQHISHYIAELQKRPYAWGEDWLPHDAKHEMLGAERTIEQQMRDAGRNVRITPNVRIADGINAVRSIFNRVWIDRNKCDDLVQSLRHYRYDVDPDTGQYSKNPLHDDYSHAADAMRYLAVSLTDRKNDEWNKPLKINTRYIV